MFILSSRACISFGPKNRSIGAAAKSQVGRALLFPKLADFSGLSILPASNDSSARCVPCTGQPRRTGERDRPDPSVCARVMSSDSTTCFMHTARMCFALILFKQDLFLDFLKAS